MGEDVRHLARYRSVVSQGEEILRGRGKERSKFVFRPQRGKGNLK